METGNTSGEQLTLAAALAANNTADTASNTEAPKSDTPTKEDVSEGKADEGGDIEITDEQKRDMLKKKATLMGITFPNNVKTEKLAELINAKLEGEEVVQEEEAPETPAPTSTSTQTPDKSVPVNEQADKTVKQSAPLTEREKLKRDAMKLIRVRISNLDPKKKDLTGEIFTIANDVLGAVKMFVPYGEVTDDGWHLPMWVYKQLEKRRFLHIRTSKDRQTGQQKVEHFYAKEFSLEVLPPLTQTELDVLARNQAAAGSIQRGE